MCHKMQDVKQSKQQELEGAFVLYPPSLLQHAHTNTHTQTSISLLTSFLLSCPPAAQVPVLVAVAGSQSGAVWSSHVPLHPCYLWKRQKVFFYIYICHSFFLETVSHNVS
ncbi:hypothetical protein AMECASPLE_019723 [Ameca splendens]|uniref:Uncharacterized protein n=1 Tax=Ameca splendens TaxID=208324 RepID=A0ABV0XG98_9TELE